MKKKKMIIKILIVAVAVIAAAYAGLYIYSQNHVLDRGETTRKDPGKLNYFEYSESGDMEGGYYSISLQRTDDDKAVLISVFAESHSSKEKKTKKTVTASRLDKILDIYREYGMEGYETLPQSDTVALDAATGTWEFVIGEESHRFSDTLDFPENAREGFGEIMKILNPEL